jgi:hypothetical protein
MAIIHRKPDHLQKTEGANPTCYEEVTKESVEPFYTNHHGENILTMKDGEKSEKSPEREKYTRSRG